MNRRVKINCLYLSLALFCWTFIVGLFLTNSVDKIFAETKTATVNVADACTLSSTVSSAHTATLNLGENNENIGSTKITTICNDGSGYVIYAVGYTENEYGNTNLIGSNYGESIATGAVQSNASSWRMKVTKDTSSYLPANLSIENNFDSFNSVPNFYTKVATYAANTDDVTGSSILSTYAVSLSTAQLADIYVGQVKYVMVHPATTVAPFDIEYMQEFASLTNTERTNIINGMVTEQVYRVKDNRDEQVYWVAKLKDGKVWMTTDLKLGNITLETDLTSANTNVASTITAATFNSWNTGSTSSYSSGQYIRMGVISSSAPQAFGATSTGVLYNYYAASAGTISGSSNSVSAEYDICPAGWRLPTGGSTAEFGVLYNHYNTNAKMRASPSNGGAGMSLGGFSNNGSRGYTGMYGLYWSSSYGHTYNMYNLLLTTSSVDASNSIDRTYGASIRCVVKT